MNSYNYILQIKNNNYFIIYTMVTILLITLGLSFLIKSYDSLCLLGYWQNNELIINVPLDNSDVVYNETKVNIESSNYEFNIKDSQLLFDENLTNYQQFILKIKDKNINYKNNQITKVTFYYNEQRIINKIINLIF